MPSAAAMFALGVLCLTVVSVTCQYVNDYDQPAKLVCDGNQIFEFIGSTHSNYYEDRRWQFRCTAAPGVVSDCAWTDYLNNFDAEILFRCPGNKVLNGIDSYHDNYFEDRKFRVWCCSVRGKPLSNCYTTDYVNGWDKEMLFNVPTGQAIVGIYSEHNNYYEDRRWKFTICSLV